MSLPITDITGIGPAIAVVLSKHGFKTIEAIAAADVEALCAVPGFGPIKAKATIAAAEKIIGAQKTGTKKKKDKKPESKSKKSGKKKKDSNPAKPGKKEKRKKSDKKKKPKHKSKKADKKKKKK